MYDSRPATAQQINAAIAAWIAETGSVDEALSIARQRLGRRPVARWRGRLVAPATAEQNRDADYRLALVNEGAHPADVVDAVHPDNDAIYRPDAGEDPIRQRRYRGFSVLGSSRNEDRIEPDPAP